MKRNVLSVVAVLAFALLVAGVAYGHVDRNAWCGGNSGWNHMGSSHRENMMGSSNGTMMGPEAEHMGPANEHMGPDAGHMGGSVPGHMTARHDGKNGDFNCPGWDTRSKVEESE